MKNNKPVIASTDSHIQSINKLIKAAKPFAEAFKENSKRTYDAFEGDEDMIQFLDRNKITPPVTAGDFRRIYEAMESFKKISKSTDL